MQEKRLSNYIGSAVVDATEGKMYGYLKDCVADGKRIKGLIVQKTGVMARDAFLPFSAVRSFGDYTVYADCRTCDPITWRNSKQYKMLYNAEIGVMGNDGRRIGRVSDFCFDEENGNLIGIEINQGFFTDITRGRSLVDSFDMRLNTNGEYEAVSRQTGGNG